MKNTKKTKISQSIVNTPKKTSLFDSILANESQTAIDLECQKYANRVGLLFKVLYNRNLSMLRNEFENRLSQLIQDVANNIDNELSKAQEDC